MTRILVVDDEADLEALIRQRFRQQIREDVYNFTFARDGQEALDKIKADPATEIMLLDINMPKMDGLSLLSRLPEVNPILKTIMVSAYGDMDNIRTAMNRGAYDFVCKPINFEDLNLTIAKTLSYVRQLKETIQAIRENNILKMYVDSTVLQFMTHQQAEERLLASELVEGTVVFVDLCGFTAMAEKTTPEQVVGVLNGFFDGMVREITGQQGYIDKFLGDAVMAVFRGKYHLDRAIEAALAIRNSVAGSEPVGLANGEQYRPQVSIGINAGDMVSGNIGSSSLRRLDYTVIGDTVNTAQRLQSVAKPGQILVTAGVEAQVRESFGLQRVGEFTLKHKMVPVEVYEVVS